MIQNILLVERKWNETKRYYVFFTQDKMKTPESIMKPKEENFTLNQNQKQHSTNKYRINFTI